MRKPKCKMKIGPVHCVITQVAIATLQKLSECSFITPKFCKVHEISYPCVTELSNTEADNQEEEVPEATVAGDAPQETQSKNKRKRKAQSKKQLEGE